MQKLEQYELSLPVIHGLSLLVSLAILVLLGWVVSAAPDWLGGAALSFALCGGLMLSMNILPIWSKKETKY